MYNVFKNRRLADDGGVEEARVCTEQSTDTTAGSWEELDVE